VCCAPYHTGAREAETPEALMRSRYAAFARGLGDYLVRTLAAAHPDREHAGADLARAIVKAREGQRFLDLLILHASTLGDEGEVLFFARIVAKGKDRSFAELSSFVREGGAWRYADGIAVAGDRLPADVRSLGRDAFLAIAARET
jgi:SEC-C motif-containing protein